MRIAEKDIASQGTVYRYLTEEGYQTSLRFNSVAGYTTTHYSDNVAEIMKGAQIAEKWPGRTATGNVLYRVEIPSDKLNGFTIPRPLGGKIQQGWEYYTKSYPEYGKGGWTQFQINPVSLDNVVIKELK